MSPAVAAESFRNLDAETRAQLVKLPSNDDVLADAMRRSRVVLGESGHHLPVPPSATRPPAIGFALMGPDPQALSRSTFPASLRNVPALELAAAGRGMLTIQPEADGIVRRVPMVMQAHGHLMSRR